MGNICRSPAAEAVMKRLIEDEGLTEHIKCDSAGTISYHTGDSPDPRMHAAAENRNINIGGYARQINKNDYKNFNLILMDIYNSKYKSYFRFIGTVCTIFTTTKRLRNPLPFRISIFGCRTCQYSYNSYTRT